jgi:putative endonuclease
MDRFFVYILYSKSLDRFYTGLTTLSIEERIENHIQKKYGNLNFTQKAEDWEMFHFIQCNDFSQARKIEIHIKKMKSKIYIQNLKSYPELVRKLLTKFTSN